MKNALIKAEEGGYVYDHIENEEEVADRFHYSDPKWWQALGKAMNWGDTDLWLSCLDKPRSRAIGLWELKWHLFIDHLIEGKDAESFFNELLK